MDIRQLNLNNSQYPESLRSLSTPPDPLFVKGKVGNGFAIAVVGTRRPSTYGRYITAQMAGELAARGVVIVSGMATGIDAIAHEAALEAGGLSIAVLACGLDQVYPSQHSRLAQRIIASGGAIISEQPEGTPPLKPFFISRNRIISGLAAATLITEAGDGSGARHTARFAVTQGRDLWAVPGHLTSPLSVLPNQLVRRDYARPAFDAADIAAYYSDKIAAPPKPLVSGRDPRERLIGELVMTGYSSTQQLVAASGLPASEVADIISLMEITGTLRNLGAGQWTLHPAFALTIRSHKDNDPLPELAIMAE